jgi:hypothetical protein
MKKSIASGIAAATLGLIGACTTSDKGSTPADTATGQATTVAPANASAPVVSPVDSVAVPASDGTAPKATTKPTSTTRPKATTTPVEPMRDSAFKPRATVDEKGNIQPIKRDSLK